MKRLAVFASGSGSNFEAIQQAILDKKIENAEIVLMVCDKPNAYVIGHITDEEGVKII